MSSLAEDIFCPEILQENRNITLNNRMRKIHYHYTIRINFEFD